MKIVVTFSKDSVGQMDQPGRHIVALEAIAKSHRWFPKVECGLHKGEYFILKYGEFQITSEKQGLLDRDCPCFYSAILLLIF